MKTSLVALGFAFAVNVMASDPTSDMLKSTKTPAALGKDSGASVKLSFSCTTRAGKTVRKEESGYAECMEEYSRMKQSPVTNGNAPNSAGFSFKIN